MNFGASSLQADCLDNLDYLKLVPSYQCTRGCSYCYNAALSQYSQEDGDTFNAGVDAILSRVTRPFVAEIIGGEPLEGSTAERTLGILRKLCAHPMCCKTLLTTAMGDPRHLGMFLPHVDFLYFSVDISSSTDNRKRTSHRYLAQLASMCRERNTELCLSVVLDGTESVPALCAFLDQALELQIANLTFGFVSFTELEPARLERYSDAFHALFRASQLLKGTLRLGGDVLESLDMHLRGQSRTHNCHCGQTSLVLQPDGKISPSICFEDNPGVSISWTEYLDEKARRAEALPRGECAGCVLWGACQGGCMGEALVATRRLSSRSPSTCAILKSTWKKIEADLAEYLDLSL